MIDSQNIITRQPFFIENGRKAVLEKNLLNLGRMWDWAR